MGVTYDTLREIIIGYQNLIIVNRYLLILTTKV
jgi:hypothetical protein